MADYIDREELMKRIQEGRGDEFYYQNEIVELIKSMPTVEQKHGHWIEHLYYGTVLYWICSECGSRTENTAYCPDCGAKMDEKCEE